MKIKNIMFTLLLFAQSNVFAQFGNDEPVVELTQEEIMNEVERLILIVNSDFSVDWEAKKLAEIMKTNPVALERVKQAAWQKYNNESYPFGLQFALSQTLTKESAIIMYEFLEKMIIDNKSSFDLTRQIFMFANIAYIDESYVKYYYNLAYEREVSNAVKDQAIRSFGSILRDLVHENQIEKANEIANALLEKFWQTNDDYFKSLYIDALGFPDMKQFIPVAKYFLETKKYEEAVLRRLSYNSDPEFLQLSIDYGLNLNNSESLILVTLEGMSYFSFEIVLDAYEKLLKESNSVAVKKQILKSLKNIFYPEQRVLDLIAQYEI